MDVEDLSGGGTDTISMVAAGNELSDGASGGFLHGDAVGFRAAAESLVFVVCEPERHGHG